MWKRSAPDSLSLPLSEDKATCTYDCGLPCFFNKLNVVLLFALSPGRR